MAAVNSTQAAKSTEDDDDQTIDCFSDGYDADTFLDDNNSGADSDYDFLQEKDGDDRDDVTYHHSYYACHRINYSVLWDSDIRQRMDDTITKVSNVLSVPRNEASLLLLHFNWSVNKVTDSWFVDESSVREKVGLLGKSVQVVGTEDGDEFVSCGICFETYPSEDLVSALCGHPYCRPCWCGYISTSINDDGLGCLKLRCPEPSCHASVTQDVIESSVPEEDKKKLSEFLIRSYIEENRKTKWCPNPGCEYAIEFLGGDGVSFDVTCRCLNSFCWNCDEESHRPLDCETVKKWIEKNCSESENVNYILKYCKPCPNCRRPIEKNGGCMHIRCRVCEHDFCWLCLKPQSNHGECNGYVETHHDWGIKRKEMALQSLEKYAHYFERWDANRKSKLKALSDFKQVKSAQYERLSEIQGVPESHFDFITKAWLQIVECRRALEWSYAYGYFMPDHETEKKLFFEHLQGVAESTLEKFHNLAEKELDRFLTITALSEDFKEFHTKLVDLTAVTACYFEKLVRALENGLSDIACHDQPSSSHNSSKDGVEDYWFCDRCTYANPGIFTECRMCVLSSDGYEPLDIDDF